MERDGVGECGICLCGSKHETVFPVWDRTFDYRVSAKTQGSVNSRGSHICTHVLSWCKFQANLISYLMYRIIIDVDQTNWNIT